MKVGEVMTAVRNIAGDVAVNQFSQELLLTWVNDGVRECALKNKLLQTRATSAITAGDADVDLPSDILKLHSVKWDGIKIEVLTLEEFDERFSGDQIGGTASGTPYVCYVWSDVINLFPSPANAGDLTIEYLKDPTDTAIGNINTTEVPLPVGYHRRIIDYCLAQVAQQDDDLNRYQLKMQEFETGVQSLKDDPENTYDEYPGISVSSRDMGTSMSWDY